MNISSEIQSEEFVIKLTSKLLNNITVSSKVSQIFTAENAQKITLDITSDQLNLVKNAKLNYLAENTSIPGFRPGKIPSNILWNRNQAVISNEIIQDLFDAFVNQYTSKKQLDFYKQPNIDIKQFDLSIGLVAEINFHLMPKFDMPDFTKFTLEKNDFEIKDADIDQQIAKIMANQKKYEENNDPSYEIKNLDRINIDYSGEIDGKKFEGGSATNSNLDIGSKVFIDNFEEQLIGHKVGDHLKVHVQFPENYQAKEFAGKKAIFAVTINKISSAVNFSNIEELANFIGGKEYTVEKLHEQIVKKLENECNAVVQNQLKIKLFDLLDEQVAFNPPEEIVLEELNSVKREFEPHQAELVNNNDINLEKLALRRVKLGILLSNFAEMNDIKVEQDDLVQLVREQAMANPAAAQSIIKYYTENRQAINSLRGPIIEDKSVKLILSQVNYNLVKSSVSELLNIKHEH